MVWDRWAGCIYSCFCLVSTRIDSVFFYFAFGRHIIVHARYFGRACMAISAAVIGLPTLCFILLGLGLLVWLGSKAKKRFDSDMKKYKDKKATFDRDTLPRWQRAKDRWEQIYFCMRDETMFIPAENKVICVDDMEKYLYDPLFRI